MVTMTLVLCLSQRFLFFTVVACCCCLGPTFTTRTSVRNTNVDSLSPSRSSGFNGAIASSYSHASSNNEPSASSLPRASYLPRTKQQTNIKSTTRSNSEKTRKQQKNQQPANKQHISPSSDFESLDRRRPSASGTSSKNLDSLLPMPESKKRPARTFSDSYSSATQPKSKTASVPSAIVVNKHSPPSAYDGRMTPGKHNAIQPVAKICRDKSQWCNKIGAKLPLKRCYRHEKRCCATCKKLALPILNCPYGDKELWCSGLGDGNTAAECYRHNMTCCQTCNLYNTGVTGCPFGDQKLWCSAIGTRYSVSSCYEHYKECCSTCNKFRLPYRDCLFGDKLAFCQGIGSVFSTSHCDVFSEQCCDTCRRHENAKKEAMKKETSNSLTSLKETSQVLTNKDIPLTSNKELSSSQTIKKDSPVGAVTKKKKVPTATLR